jgi:glycosidase
LDPRAAFPWQDPSQWDHDLLAFYRRAIALRHHTPALRTGAFQRLHAEGGIDVFARTLP